MNARLLRFLFLFALLVVAFSAPWWLGPQISQSLAISPAKEFHPPTAVDRTSTDALQTRGMEREIFTQEQRKSVLSPRLAAATQDGKSRIRVRLEGFEEDPPSWLQVMAIEQTKGLVYRQRGSDFPLEMELDPGHYRISIHLGESLLGEHPRSKSVLHLDVGQQSFAEQKARVLWGKTTEVVFQSNFTGTIFGVARHGKMPVTDIKVQLVADQPLFATTDEQGKFRFENVPVGHQLIRLVRPRTGAAQGVTVCKDEEHGVDFQVPVSGFRVLVRHQESGQVLTNVKVQLWFSGRDSLQEGVPWLLSTGPDGFTPVLLTGPGVVHYTVSAPQNFGLAAIHGSFLVEDFGTRDQELALSQGVEVFLRREQGCSGRMNLATLMSEDGVELACGGVARLDDDSGYRVWGVPPVAGRIFLSRTRGKRLWMAEISASYEQQRVTAKEWSLVPVVVRSAVYPDGTTDSAVTLLAVLDAKGKSFPIGPIYPRSFGLRRAAGGGMVLRPAEVVALPPASYTLIFAHRNGSGQKIQVNVEVGAEKIVLDLAFRQE